MTLSLTPRQAKILAACGLCHRPLAWRGVKAALEFGEADPPDLCCARCAAARPSPATHLSAALKILRRIEAAGLTEHYERVAVEADYPPRRPAA